MLGVMMGPGVGGIHGGCEGMPGSSKAVRALGAVADSAAEGVQGAVELGGGIGDVRLALRGGPHPEGISVTTTCPGCAGRCQAGRGAGSRALLELASSELVWGLAAVLLEIETRC